MIGHPAARAYLERELPAATLLHGPASVGKWTLATHLAEHHHVSSFDRWAVPHGLTVDTVRLVVAYAARAPMGRFKLVLVRLDGSSRPAMHALLKTLEEPPPRVKFLLTSASWTMPTIASRCIVFQLGMLSVAELEQVYRVQGYSPAKAAKAAALARGQVARGYEIDSVDAHRNQAMTVARALVRGDRELFDSVFKTWDTLSTQTLTTLLTECLTRRWSTFTEADCCDLHTDRPRLLRMLTAMRRLPSARPRLGVRTALEPFLRRTT